MGKITFEEKVDELDELLRKNRGKWQLDAISWLDYDDVCQIIRLHIVEKWDMWDQERPFKPWANTVISNQIKNQIRNHYGNFAKPCLKCPHNAGDADNHCFLTKSGKQCAECPLYAKWEKRKKRAYDVKLPVSLSEVAPRNKSGPLDSFDYDTASKKLHQKVMNKIKNKKQKYIYYLLYIEHKSEEEVAKEMGFKADTSKRKSVRYKQIKNLQKRFKNMAKEILEEEDIFY